jgi:signal peptidase II
MMKKGKNNYRLFDMAKPLIKSKDKKFWIIVSVVFLIDQFSKQLVYNHFIDYKGNEISLFPFLNLVLVWNYGISFGMLDDIEQGQIVFVALSVFLVLILYYWYKKGKNIQLVLPISLIIGGAIGNIMDRLKYSAVLDFIDFDLWGWHYPTFNIADIAIVLGVIAMLMLKKKL